MFFLLLLFFDMIFKVITTKVRHFKWLFFLLLFVAFESHGADTVLVRLPRLQPFQFFEKLICPKSVVLVNNFIEICKFFLFLKNFRMQAISDVIKDHVVSIAIFLGSSSNELIKGELLISKPQVEIFISLRKSVVYLFTGELSRFSPVCAVVIF